MGAAVRHPIGLVAALALAPALAGGCISNGPPAVTMCETTEDCDHAAGEVCDEGVCYGDPPEDTRFAAVLVPAEDRVDLALTELPLLAIGRDGTIDGLTFAPSVSITGRILLACPAGEPTYKCGPEASIGAQITVEREAGFAGGPPWNRQVVAAADVPVGGLAFALRLPQDPDARYRITITPTASESFAGEVGTSPAELAPPRQLTITAGDDRTVEWKIGDPAELKQIIGCVTNAAGNGHPYAGMQVTALGRWTSDGELVRASSLATTDMFGCFLLNVPIAMQDAFDILVKPAADAALPSIRLRGEEVPDPASGEDLLHEIFPRLVMPDVTTPVAYVLPLRAPDADGGETPVAGADVRFTTSFATEPVPGRTMDVTYEVHAVTTGLDSADPGLAEVMLYPGVELADRLYQVAVVPPGGSEFAATWNVDVPVGPGGGTLAELVLGRRVAVSGRFETADGTPIAGAPVEVRLSSVFRWTVEDPAIVAAAEAIPLSTATTEEDGRFFLWLDREILDAEAYYDLEVKPATYAAPRWSLDGITLGSGVATDLGALRLPEASYARGVVREPSGAEVATAELRLYQLPERDLCDRTPEIDPSVCDPPAVLRGVFASDEAGVVRPVLPDP